MTSSRGDRVQVLVLTSSTGGGHDMRARSLQQWANEREVVTIHSCLEATHPLYAFGVELYNWIQRTAPFLHHIYFNYLEVGAMFEKPWKILGADKFYKFLDQEKPDVIVSVHGSCNHAFFDLARKHRPDIHCITYCGELSGGYGFSKHWVNPEADLFIGAVEDTCEQAQSLGMPAERTWCGGFLLNPKFWDKPLTPAERKNLLIQWGFDPEKFLLVLGTGAVGANNHLQILRTLNRAKIYPQVLALCGKNHRTFEAIKNWASHHPHMTVKAWQYTKDMHQVMQCASAILARPGTGTTSEAIQSDCPIIFNGIGGIMPQECITEKFARKHGFSNIIYNPNQLSQKVKQWMESPDLLEKTRKAMQSVKPSSTPRDIWAKIHSLVVKSHDVAK